MFEPRKIDWTPELIQRFWDYYSSNPALEDTYFAKSVGRHLIDFVRARIPIGVAVDFGCGRGDLIGYLLSRHVCYAVEQSPESVATVNHRFGEHPRFKGAFVSTRQLADSSADTVFAVEVAEHMDDSSLEILFAEARRVLRKGGHLVVTTPNNEDLGRSQIMCPSCGCIFHNMQHLRSWSPETLSHYIAKFGFKGAATPAILTRRNGFLRLAEVFIRKALRRPRRALIYIGAAVDL